MSAEEEAPLAEETGEAEGSSPGNPRLLTVAEVAELTSLSKKAIRSRIERGTLPSVKGRDGARLVPRKVLESLDLLGDDSTSAGNPAGELVLWREMYEREREEKRALAERERELQERAAELREELAAIANAGPIRAYRLRRLARSRLDT